MRSSESRAERAGFAPRPVREGAERQTPRREGEWVGGTDNPIVSRRKREEVKRFDALDRLDTKSGKGNRGVNVWTAPGARPRSSKPLEKPVELRGEKPSRQDERSRAFKAASKGKPAPEGRAKPRSEAYAPRVHASAKPRFDASAAPAGEAKPRREGAKPFGKPSFSKDGKPAPRGPRPAGGGFKGKPGNADRRR